MQSISLTQCIAEQCNVPPDVRCPGIGLTRLERDTVAALPKSQLDNGSQLVQHLLQIRRQWRLQDDPLTVAGTVKAQTIRVKKVARTSKALPAMPI